MTESPFHAAHLADELPLLVSHRLRQRLDRAGGHGDPGLALAGGRIRIGLAENFADADDLLLVAGMIEEELVALLHLLEIFARREIAHAAPRLAFVAALDLIVPGKFLGLRLHQPMGHVIPPTSKAASARTRSPRPRSIFARAAPRPRPRSACRPNARAPCPAAPAR